MDNNARALWLLYRLWDIEKLYRIDGNPIWAWIGYRTARCIGIEIPEWIVAYLDGVAERVASEPPTAVKQVPSLFGFGKFHNGGSTPDEESDATLRNWHIHMRVSTLLERRVVRSRTKAREMVAEMLEIPFKSVEEADRAILKVLPEHAHVGGIASENEA